ncbi:gp58-like family protein [Streptococcus sp. sy004]|uniref:gp58-like family protein n=1 Tax=Streptococcus sp. sy004 TaxID=2600149 RepID=UPI0011B74AF7|nr:gp58-like family protein [Streptococcus sp. sy004]TWT12082.1 hypothetical protein FRX54_00705 [Streptococcus sp. sy004]
MDAGPALEDVQQDISSVKTTITQTAEGQEQLSRRISQTEDKVSQADTQIKQLVGEVSSKVSRTDYDRLSQTVTNYGTTLTQTEKALALKAEKTVVDQVKGVAEQAQTNANNAAATAQANAQRIRQTQADLQVASDAIRTKVSQTDFNQATDRLRTAETSIDTLAGQIVTKLSRTEVEQAITNKGYQTQGDVERQINAKDFVTVRTLTTRLEQSEQGLTSRISQAEARMLREYSGNLLVDSGSGWTNLHQKDFVISEPMYSGSTYTITSRWWRSDNSRLNFGIRRNASDSWQWIDLTYDRQIDAWTATFTLTKSLNAGDVVSFFTIEPTGRGSAAWATLSKGSIPLSVWEPSYKELVTETKFHEVKDTVDSHKRTIAEQGQSISQVVQTAQGLVSRVASLSPSNLVYDPTSYSKYREREPNSNLSLIPTTSNYKLLRITQTNRTSSGWRGFQMPLHTQTFVSGEKLSYRVNLWVDTLPDRPIGFEIKAGGAIGSFTIRPTRTGSGQIFTGTFTVNRTVVTTDDYALHVWLERNGQVAIGQLMIVRGDTPPESFVDNTSSQQIATETQMTTLAGSYAIRNLISAGSLISGINLGANGYNRISGRATQITGDTLIDNAVIKSAMIDKLKTANFEAGSISGVILSADSITANQLQIDQAFFNKLMANEAYLGQLFAKNAFISQVQAIDLSANRIVGGVLASTNGALRADLNSGVINFFSETPALRRQVNGYGNQYIKFETGGFTRDGKTGYRANKTIIGSNRSNSESAEGGDFAGLRIWNMNHSDGSTADLIDVVGDTIAFQDTATGKTRSPWILETYTPTGDIHFYPSNDNGRRHHLGTGGNKFKTIYGESIYGDNLYVQGVRVAQMLKDLALHVGYKGNDGWVDRIG